MDEIGDKSSTRVRLEGDDTLVLEVAATDISGLRAALNTWLRLINIALEMQEIVDPASPRM